MKILAIESSAKAASCAVVEDEKMISQYYQASGLTHSRTLMPMVEDLLKNLDMALDDIDAIAVAKGPGSFTGIRIGVAIAKGLAWADDKPVYGTSTLQSMAEQIFWNDGIICSVMDARRSQVYNAKFRRSGNKLERICDDRAISLEELEEEIKNDKEKYFFVGDGAELCYNHFLDKGYDITIAPENLRLQTAYGVGLAALSEKPLHGSDLKPVYLRQSQAERERLEKINISKEN